MEPTQGYFLCVGGMEWGEWEERDLEGVRRGKEELTEFGIREGTEWARLVVRLGEAAERPPRRGEAET